jgi:hypothetical protein
VIPKPFDDVTKADIDNLVKQAQSERRTLEYKQALPSLRAFDDKIEYLADVSSFANASGGDLLFGVVDKRDVDGKPTGIPESAPGVAGADILALEQSANSLIAPRISGLQIKAIPDFPNNRVVVLVRIPRSHAGPHIVKNGDWGRFYTRGSQGKRSLDVGEIRSAFALSESLPQRIREFRAQRLAAILAGETPMVLQGTEGKVILHLLPISAFDLTSTAQLDLARLTTEFGNLPLLLEKTACSKRYNLDGLLFHNGKFSYTQVFRNGAIEAVDSYTLASAGKPFLPDVPIEQRLLSGVQAYLPVLRQLGVTPPLLLMVSLLGVKGLEIVQGHQRFSSPPIDRDDLILPEVLVEDMRAEPARLLRKVFDMIWQSAGIEGSRNFNQQRQWVPRQW